MKIWEVHSLNLGGGIRTTHDGEADLDGLILSEKAYLLAVRDFRPAQLVRLVKAEGPLYAAQALIEHYADPESLQSTGGRGLAIDRNSGPDITVRRTDEMAIAAGTRRL
jgi:hypothetical protein